MRKEFIPVALGFWGIALPLLVSVFVYCKTPAQKITVFISSVIFFLLGFLSFRAKI
ncbi:MAG: hypothetical protein ACE5LC_07590 [Candidatus Aminicenantales bacterium]